MHSPDRRRSNKIGVATLFVTAEACERIVVRSGRPVVLLAEQADIDSQRDIRIGMPKALTDRHDVHSSVNELGACVCRVAQTDVLVGANSKGMIEAILPSETR